MKPKIYLIPAIYLFFVIAIGIAYAGGKWEISDLEVEGKKQMGGRDIYFIDKNNGWIVGQDGDERLILHTSDGGKTWQRQSKKSKWTQYIYANESVHFVDSQNGWIVGGQGLILHTSNGGLVWLKQEGGPEPLNIGGFRYRIGLNSVYFTDKNNGWSVGELGTILHTENGGLTWKRQSSGTIETLEGIHCVDRNTCWTVGGGGIILNTTNGGKKWFGFFRGWKKQDSGTGAYIYGVYFADKDNGWVVGAGGISHTSNGGKTWTTQARFSKTHLLKVFFINKKKGWAVGTDFNNRTDAIKYTEDGGKTWVSYPSGTIYYGLKSVFFIDENTGFAVAEHGIILRYVGEDGTGKKY